MYGRKEYERKSSVVFDGKELYESRKLGIVKKEDRAQKCKK